MCNLSIVALQGWAEEVDIAKSYAEIEKKAAAALASDDPLTVAWGAYWAGHCKLKSCEPALKARLGKEPSKDLMPYLLDGLICLESKLRAEELKPILKYGGTCALILASYEPQKHVETLRVVAKDSPGSKAWTAANNLLAGARDKIWATQTFKDVEIQLAVFVTDPDGYSLATLGSHSVSFQGCGSSRVTENWPPEAGYNLVDSFIAGFVLLADGPHPIWYRRREDPHFLGHGSHNNFSSDTTLIHQHRLDLLKYSMSKPGPEVYIGFKASESETIRWEDSDAYDASLKKACERITEGYQALADKLVTQGLMEKADAAALSCKIHLEVKDERKVESLPNGPSEWVEKKEK